MLNTVWRGCESKKLTELVWSASWLAGWLAGQLAGQLAGWLAGWLWGMEGRGREALGGVAEKHLVLLIICDPSKQVGKGRGNGGRKTESYK